MSNPKRVILAVDNNRGYGPEQVPTSMTLADLLALVETAIDEHGEDALVVTKDSGNRYGANWGAVSSYEDITAVGACPYCEEAEEDCECDDEE